MRKGISPIVGAILLIFIAVVILALVYYALYSYATNVIKRMTPIPEEEYSIISVSYDSTKGKLTVVVENTGNIQVKLIKLRITKLDGRIILDRDINVKIDPMKTATISLTNVPTLPKENLILTIYTEFSKASTIFYPYRM